VVISIFVHLELDAQMDVEENESEPTMEQAVWNMISSLRQTLNDSTIRERAIRGIERRRQRHSSPYIVY
jgi:hypothetical protein